MKYAAGLDWSRMTGGQILLGVGAICATVVLYHLATMLGEARTAPQEQETERLAKSNDAEIKIAQIASEREIELRRLELENELELRRLEFELDESAATAADVLAAAEVCDVDLVTPSEPAAPPVRPGVELDTAVEDYR